jgi:hypothetical protein
MLGGELVDVDDAVASRLPSLLSRAARASGPIRGLALTALAGRDGILALVAGEPGTASAVVFSALRRRRRIVLLELIEPPPSPSAWRRGLREAWRRRVLRPAAARSVLAAQVLTEAEREECSLSFGIPPERIRHLPWAWCRDPEEPAPSGERAGVVVSGRASCDWETVFAAAHRRDWDLTAICGERDLPLVGALNRDGAARVLVEVPRDEHDRIVRAAAVYVVALKDLNGSAGQVRLMTAVQARTPAVTSAVPALEGYTVGDETALVVPPGDPGALGTAVDRLLADPGLAAGLARGAFERAKAWSYPMYFDAVRELIRGPGGGPPAAP